MGEFDYAVPSRRPGHVTVRSRFVALRLNYRVLTFALAGSILLILLATFAMTRGSYTMPFGAVAKAVVGHGNPEQEMVVRTLRLPRVISAILIGAALAMSGAIFQGLVRNPLVSPDIIGISEGAGLCAVFWIVTGLDLTLLPLAAFVGAALTAAAIYLLTWKGGISPHRLILVGIGIGAMLRAGTSYLTVRYPVEQVRPAVVWQLGSVYGSDWGDVKIMGAVLLALAPVAVALTWHLRTLQLGDGVARSLGLSLERSRLGLIVAGCALAAVAVALAGPIGFVALMVPHIARMLAGPPSGSVMVFTGVLGALFLLGADVIAQHALPTALPVGVITGAVGAPYFLFLLYRVNTRM
ncbi:MAG: iron ABC transporter permease [Thermomicrobiales bacterium]|nr:MAG: iron ABC transporter permease [Thermomicrobiales bacterium]